MCGAREDNKPMLINCPPKYELWQATFKPTVGDEHTFAEMLYDTVFRLTTRAITTKKMDMHYAIAMTFYTIWIMHWHMVFNRVAFPKERYMEKL